MGRDRHTRWIRVGLLAAFVATTAAHAAEPYLFELLARPTWLASWNALFVREKSVEPWLAGYARTKEGPSTPGARVTIGAREYVAAHVCKRHDCGDNRFTVLFSADGAKAWGLLRSRSSPERFFGAPDEALRAGLRAVSEQ